MTKRTINFYAGPAGLPLPALERAKEELVDFAGTGMSVMEISHRSKEYDAVHEEALALTRELLDIPANYKVILLQGGAHLSFGMIPLNWLRGEHKADYIVTGNWAEKAYKEAKLVGGEDRVRLAGSTKDQKFARLPKASELKLNKDSLFVHFTSNNTVEGTQWQAFPETGGIPYVCDMSSDIMWRPFDVSKFGMIYAGAQKNLGPSGVTLHIVSDEFLEKAQAADLPSYLRYKLHAEKNSLYNTPPTFGIYILRNVLAYNKSIGGLKAIEANNRKKGDLLYGCIDRHAGFFKPFVTEKADRSLMNVDFFLPTEELTDAFVKEAKKEGMVGLKGYRDIGGIRVSTYNAVTVENVQTLVDFMETFVKKNG
ncbi:3-phosphoserine/phosphohydroxythreonine transaminase [Mesoterricola sediminis]|uniref:Phosphoserine aminotransferase n=1 Tax=Mesoterricola sediminis TaxID=2927980 RepID=A0AA48GV37_9BACT|nr:3-phosphoserine/phosphohydroxythreonine transaminase [Mesoterricola sediminis]BDU76180.1 phosphoserine aminotransferase [Mesoterricola sediminis]